MLIVFPRGVLATSVILDGGGNVIVVALFAISWWLRRSAPGEPSETAITLSIVAVLIALVTGWLV